MKERFTIEKEAGLFYLFDQGKLVPVLDGQPVVDLLNELSEENEQLNQEVSKLTDLMAEELEKNAKFSQEINSLKIKNMQLKEKLKFTWEQIDYSEKLREMLK